MSKNFNDCVSSKIPDPPEPGSRCCRHLRNYSSPLFLTKIGFSHFWTKPWGKIPPPPPKKKKKYLCAAAIEATFEVKTSEKKKQLCESCNSGFFFWKPRTLFLWLTKPQKSKILEIVKDLKGRHLGIFVGQGKKLKLKVQMDILSQECSY